VARVVRKQREASRAYFGASRLDRRDSDVALLYGSQPCRASSAAMERPSRRQLVNDVATVAKNRVVSIEYVLKDDDGQIVDSNQGSEPLVYLHGHGQIVTGLEDRLEGMAAGEEVHVDIEAGDGYGVHDPSRVFSVPRAQIEFDVSAGDVVQAQHPDGQTVPLQVVSVDDDKVTLDGNHPMAGKGLHFDVKVVGVRPATDQEIEHGHAH
jgi:FKBP-type peptidyl-prolyl cis-trans isomerase SlyD